MSFSVDHQAPQDRKDLAVTKADALFQNLKSKTVAELETYFRDNLSQIAFLSDQEIDTQIDGLSNTQLKTALKMLAKDNAFQARTQLLFGKLLIILSKNI